MCSAASQKIKRKRLAESRKIISVSIKIAVRNSQEMADKIVP